MTSLPTDIATWKNSDVLNFLSIIHMSKYAPSFKKHMINGKDLLELTEHDLAHELAIPTIHERKKLRRNLYKIAGPHRHYINRLDYHCILLWNRSTF